MTALDTVLDRLEFKKSGTGWIAKCPSHDDQQPSLSIGTGEDGKVLLHCHVGCTTEQIVAALGLTLSDLFPKSNREGKGGKDTTQNRFEPSNPSGLTLGEYAASKRFSTDFLHKIGVSGFKLGRSNVVRFEYRDSNGDLLAVRFRVGMTGNRFRWRRGDKICLYGLWKLGEARAKGYLTICEGESDTQTLWFHDEPALGFPGADAWQEAWAEYLSDIPTIYIYFEPDKGGGAVKQWLSKSAIRDRVRLLDLGGYKDPSAFYLADPETFLDRWQAALAAAVPFVDVQQAEQNQAYALAKDLLHDPKLLNRIGKVIRA